MMQEEKKIPDIKPDIIEKSGANLDKVMSLIEKDQTLAKNMLARLSGTEPVQPVDTPDEFAFLDSITKPTWIDKVKKIQKNIMTPEVKKKEVQEKVKQVKLIVNENEQAEKDKAEEYKEYPFFTIIKKIMYANGDLKLVKDESVVTMHKFVTKMINTIFDKQLLVKYFDSEKKHEKGEKTIRHKTSMLKKLLSKLYPQEYFKFFQFNKIAKNVERLDYDLEKTTEVADESKLFNYESDNDSEDGLSFKLINCNIRDEEKANFNQKRMELLDEVEYLEFVACRSTNFLSDGKDKLLSFLDLDSKDLGFVTKNKTMVEFIAYILCRVVGNTVENLVRHTNHGVLKPLGESLDPEQIDAEADKHLTSIKFQAKKAIRDSLSIEEIAFRLFVKESRENNNNNGVIHELSHPVKHRKRSDNEEIKVIRRKSEEKIFLEDEPSSNHQIQQIKQNSLKTEWKKLSVLKRKQWIDRVVAEKQVKELMEKVTELHINWDDIDPVNSYAEYLINSLRDVKEKDKITDFVFKDLFKKYQNNEVPLIYVHSPSQAEGNFILSNKTELSKVTPIVNNDIKKPTAKKRRLESIFE